jgi:hypothetical protein
MPAAGASFPGVNYNDKKINSGKGELMLMKNFPSFINESSDKQQVRDYLRAISVANKKIIKPQFHAMISTKFQEHSKEELTEIAENFMREMRYGDQPFTVVFHSDTDNNHVHIVSTRVDKTTGKKINDSFEKLKSQEALSKTLEKLYNIKPDEELEKLLKYKVSTIDQLKLLLERIGFVMIKNKLDEQAFDILKNRVKQRIINSEQINFETNKNDSRKNQIKALLIKYKAIHSNKVFKVEDSRRQKSVLPENKDKSEKDISKVKVEFESELQEKMRNLFGIDIVFHQKDNFQPFGYTLIDHKSERIYKGSEILKMTDLFEFTDDKIDKQLYEVLKDYHIPNEESKLMLLKFLRQTKPEIRLKEFILFENKKNKNLETYRKIQEEVKHHVRNILGRRNDKQTVSIVKSETGKFYAISQEHHFVGELQNLIGEKEYQNFFNPQKEVAEKVMKAVDEIFFELMKISGTAKDPGENELKKRRKKRK